MKLRQPYKIVNIYPPISVKKMDYTARLNQNNYLISYDFKTDMTAKDLFYVLREYYSLDRKSVV